MALKIKSLADRRSKSRPVCLLSPPYRTEVTAKIQMKGWLPALQTGLYIHDIEIISIFRTLRVLQIEKNSHLNGRYPVLFNFSLLQSLDINSSYLKWDLEMLTGLPLLKELFFEYNHSLDWQHQQFEGAQTYP